MQHVSGGWVVNEYSANTNRVVKGVGHPDHVSGGWVVNEYSANTNICY